jgi:hypothetical protein
VGGVGSSHHWCADNPGLFDLRRRQLSSAVSSQRLCCCAAGILIFPWGGDTPDWTPLDGGAYAGLNVALGPALQPNATQAWAEIGSKIRAGQGQSLPALGDETPRSRRNEIRAETEDGEMPASLEEARRMIRSLQAQLRAAA